MARVDSAPSVLRAKKFTYDFAVHGGAAATFILGQLPDNVLVVAGALDAPTAFTSLAAPTISVGIQNHGGVIVTAAKGATPFQGTPSIATTTAYPHKTTTTENVFLVTDEDLTAGVLNVWFQYYQSE